MATLPCPGLVFPALSPTRKSPASPTPDPLGLGHCPPQPQACSRTLPLFPYLGAQRQGLLSIAAPSVYYCLRRPLLVLREVPFMDISLLGGVGLGPNSVKPFWDQGLALLGTRRCVDPLPARPVLSWVWGQALPVGMAAPAPCRIECCRLARLHTPSALFPSDQSDRVPAVGKQPSPLSPGSRGDRRTQSPSILAGVLWVSGGPSLPLLALPQPV